MKFGIEKIGIALCMMLLVSCAKELSLEEGEFVPGNTSEGTLSGAPGACANITVLGAYGQGLGLDTGQNKLQVEVNFTKEGSWYIYTDTVNGFYFSGFGTVAAAGITTVELKGGGIPANPGTFNLTVKYKGSTCVTSITVYQTANASSGDYFPMTANSWWTYIASDPAATPGDTAYQLSTGLTGTLPGGATYNLFTTTIPGSKDSSFYRKSGGDYFQFGDLDVTGSTDAPVLAEWIFLKDNVAMGTLWQSSEQTAMVSGVPIKIRMQFELLAKDVNVLVDNKVYAKTIKVKNTLQAQLTAPSWTNVVSYESWFAKGIGLINVVLPAPDYGYKVLKYSVN